MIAKSSQPIIILGAGGHAKVVTDVLVKSGYEIIGIVTPDKERDSLCFGYRVIGDDDELDSYRDKDFLLANGIGFLPGKSLRWDIAMKMREKGHSFVNVIHPSAIIADDVTLVEGVQVMAGSIIQPGVHIGRDTIINTGACIDHDCNIGKNCHFAPGVTLSGDVQVDDGVHIGTGSSVIQGKTIGTGTVIAAASVIYHDIPDNVTYIQSRQETIELNRN